MSNAPVAGTWTARKKQVTTVTFTINQQSYTRDSVDIVQILHYKDINGRSLLSNSALSSWSLSSRSSAEIVIFYHMINPESVDQDVDKIILHCMFTCVQIRHDGGLKKAVKRILKWNTTLTVPTSLFSILIAPASSQVTNQALWTGLMWPSNSQVLKICFQGNWRPEV